VQEDRNEIDVGMPRITSASVWAGEFGARGRSELPLLGRYRGQGSVQVGYADGFGATEVCRSRANHQSPSGPLGRRRKICRRQYGVLDEGQDGASDALGRRNRMQNEAL